MTFSISLSKPIVRWGRFFAISALVGAVSGVATALLELGLRTGVAFLVGRLTDLGQARLLTYQNGLLLLPALGGLLAGVLIRWFNPRDHGHGTDLYIRAFHRHRGVLPLRGPILNAVAAAGVISCGGSAGPEGPTAALGASIGSALGRVFKLTARERRVVLVAGCGAGIGAIFQCPLGGALFAVSVLYREPDFETDAVAPACISSVTGYSVYMSFWGYGSHLLRGANTLVFSSPRELVPYLLLGLLCALAAFLLRACLNSVHDVAFRRLSLPRWLSAGIGGLATGAVACVLPPVMDGQYHFIQNAMDNTLLNGLEAHSWWWWTAFFGAVTAAKCLATGLTIGSGTPGGVLGPGVFIGGALGACVGAFVLAVAPDTFTNDPENLRRALIPVGMAGLLSASMRVPLAALVMVTEMTGSYGLIVPLMLVCFTSYLVGRRWGLSPDQVQSSAHSPAHAGDLVVHLLESETVGAAMDKNWPLVVRRDTTFQELLEKAELGTCPEFIVVENGRLLGTISLLEIRSLTSNPSLANVVIAADIMTAGPSHMCEDDSLYHALTVMIQNRRSALPVVKRRRGNDYIGVITSAQVHRALRARLDQTRSHVLREHKGLSAIESEETMHQIATGTSLSGVDCIQRLLVPLQVVGHSLRRSDFRKAFGVQVIAIEQPDGSIQCPPDVECPLRTNQRLIAIVPRRPADADETNDHDPDTAADSLVNAD